MKTRLDSKDLFEMALEVSYPEQFYDPQSEITERSYGAGLLLGQGSYREIFFKGVHIGFGDIELSKDTIISFESDMETIEMHFKLSGFSSVESNSHIPAIEIGSNQHNIFYTNGFKGVSKWGAKPGMKVFEINLLPEFIISYFPKHSKIFDRFRQTIENQKSSLLMDNHLPITGEMHTIIHDIIYCNRKGKFKRMFLESKVMELLLLQFEQAVDLSEENKCTLKKPDIEKIHAVKEYLWHHTDGNTTLKELALQVGTNEFTLKKGFRELYGTTVFRYWSELKMKEAKRMLTNEKATVSEVADFLGYKHSQHFSTAFKRQFGINPSELK